MPKPLAEQACSKSSVVRDGALPTPDPSPPDQELLVLREFELVPHLFRLFISEAYFGKLKVKLIGMVNLE